MNIAKSPGANVATIYGLSGASTAYLPALSAAPSDWTFFATYSGGGMNGPSSLSIDSQGNVWVANYFAVASLFSNTGTPVFASGLSGYGLLNSYGGAVDVNDTMWVANEQSTGSVNGGLGSVTLFNSAGASPAQYTSGGLNFPIAVAFDTSGVAWVVNYGNSHVTLLEREWFAPVRSGRIYSRKPRISGGRCNELEVQRLRRESVQQYRHADTCRRLGIHGLRCRAGSDEPSPSIAQTMCGPRTSMPIAWA